MRPFVVLSFSAIVALSGCALAPVLEGGGTVDAVVSEVLIAARAPSPEKKAALSRAKDMFSEHASDENRLRLATMLAVLAPPLRDDARALELLRPLADASSAGTGRFAALLIAQIVDRQRLAREIERLSREAEQAAREREKDLRDRAAADKERDKREESMRQQLEALRSIERGILEREERLRRKPR
jgi:hypothetical protein